MEKIINCEDFRMKVINMLKLYGYYDGILIKDNMDRKFVSGEVLLIDIIGSKKDYKELKFSVLNKSGGTLRNVRVYVDLYDCETDEQILGCFVTEDYFYSSDISTWFCMPGTGKEFKGESWYSITTAEVRG